MASLVTVQKYEDPTMETVLGLDDDRYVVVRNVPIFRSHTRVAKGADGEPETKVVVKDEDLVRLAEQVNKQFVEDGLPLVITIGHRQQTDPNFPEEKQPKVVGFAKDARVGRFGPSNRLALLVDMYIRSDCWEEAKRHPFRSVDFYPQSGKISGIALLTRDAFLPLGAISYQSSGVCSVRYEAPPGGVVVGGIRYVGGQRVPSDVALRYSLGVSSGSCCGPGLVCYEMSQEEESHRSLMNDRAPLNYRGGVRRYRSMEDFGDEERLWLILDAYRGLLGGAVPYCSCSDSLWSVPVDLEDDGGWECEVVDVDADGGGVDGVRDRADFELRVTGELTGGSIFDLLRLVAEMALRHRSGRSRGYGSSTKLAELARERVRS